MFQRHSSCVLLLKTCLKGKVCNLGHLYDKSQVSFPMWFIKKCPFHFNRSIHICSIFLFFKSAYILCVCVGGGWQFHFAVKGIGTIKILTFIHSFIAAFLNYKICKVNIIFYSVEIKEGPKMNDNLFMPLS